MQPTFFSISFLKNSSPKTTQTDPSRFSPIDRCYNTFFCGPITTRTSAHFTALRRSRHKGLFLALGHSKAKHQSQISDHTLKKQHSQLYLETSMARNHSICSSTGAGKSVGSERSKLTFHAVSSNISLKSVPLPAPRRLPVSGDQVKCAPPQWSHELRLRSLPQTLWNWWTGTMKGISPKPLGMPSSSCGHWAKLVEATGGDTQSSGVAQPYLPKNVFPVPWQSCRHCWNHPQGLGQLQQQAEPVPRWKQLEKQIKWSVFHSSKTIHPTTTYQMLTTF